MTDTSHAEHIAFYELDRPGRATLYLDEVERRARCRARGCGGPVRLALSHRGDTSGFVGGMA